MNKQWVSSTLSGVMATMVLVTSPGQALSNPWVMTPMCHVSSFAVECFAMKKAWPGFALPPVGEEGAEREGRVGRPFLSETITA